VLKALTVVPKVRVLALGCSCPDGAGLYVLFAYLLPRFVLAVDD
jgi:hypothetical protein